MISLEKRGKKQIYICIYVWYIGTHTHTHTHIYIYIYIYTTSHRDKCYEIKDEAGEGGVVESDQW